MKAMKAMKEMISNCMRNMTVNMNKMRSMKKSVKMNMKIIAAVINKLEGQTTLEEAVAQTDSFTAKYEVSCDAKIVILLIDCIVL